MIENTATNNETSRRRLSFPSHSRRYKFKTLNRSERSSTKEPITFIALGIKALSFLITTGLNYKLATQFHALRDDALLTKDLQKSTLEKINVIETSSFSKIKHIIAWNRVLIIPSQIHLF